MSDTRLAGMTVAITGASSGIGRATALALADAGARVAIGARRVDRLEALAAEIEAEGGEALALELDVTQAASARAFADQAHGWGGGLDALVNNAGVMYLGSVEGADIADWHRMLDVNLMGVLHCTHAALPLMREHGGGHLVNVSSLAGRQASFGHAVYNLTKFGICGFSESLRMEALHSGIRVTVIEPGFVDSELHDNAGDQLVRDLTAKTRAKIGKVLDPQDIARGVLYALAQPEHVSVNEVLIRASNQRG